MSLMLSAGTRYIPKRNRNFARAATWKPEDEIIYLIQCRMEHGFVKLDADLKRGDELRAQCGALEGLRGVFDRRTRSSTRVLMLLKAVSYQACGEVEELQISRVG